MGMAASQARFLGLTARKTNVEYEGQQINQQRTSLANQTANYYNQLLGMTVPTPPSVSDFTKTVYTFQDGNLTNSISSMIAQSNGIYQVSYTSSWTNDFTPVSGVSSVVVTVGDDTEGERLYEEFINGTAGGCYTYLLDKSHDGTSSSTRKTQLTHICHVINHMLPLGNYTTSDGNSLSVIKSSGINGQYWSTPQPPYGGDAATMAKIAEAIDEKPIQQKLVDLLYNTQQIYNSSNTTTQETLDTLRDQLTSIVDIDLKAALSATYYVGNSEFRMAGYLLEATYNTDGTINKYLGNDEYLQSLSPEQLNETIKQEQEYIKMLDKKYGDATWMVRYIKNTTTGVYEPYFYTKENLKNCVYSDNGESLSLLRYYKMGSAAEVEEVKGVTARLEKDSTGRYINITLNPGEANQVTYALTTTTLTDQNAYDDAMNQYEYDKHQYDQSIQEINAKIEIIQAQDKNLELRLKQLDTEQDAITNEMDAVQKVIEKNTESTFKTFA